MKTIRSINIWTTLVIFFGLASVTQAATINLAWAPNTETDLSGYVVLYGTQPSTYPTTIAAGNNTSLQVPNLVNGTRYYFVVKACNTSGMCSAPSQEASGVASDSTVSMPAPSAPTGPTPATGATGVSVTAVLSWGASTNATQYNVAIGTTNPPTVVASNQTTTTYQPVALVAGTTYYWQIVARGAGGSTSGPIWSFTTAARPVPVAAYAFNEGAGTATGDGSSNGRTGTLTNTTWIAAGKNGGALSFNGTSSRVTVSDAPALHLASGMTLEAWINPSGAGAPDWQAIIYKGTDNYTIATLGSNLPTAAGTVGGTLAMATSASTLPVNAWTHLATTYDGAMVRLFINGTQVASQPATGVFDVSTNPLEIGGSLVDGGPFAGLIDDVRVYNTALTPAQIQTDMTTPVPSPIDTQAPTAPTTLTVTAASTTQLTLTWAASTDDIGVTGYRIERCAGAGCTTFSQVGTASATSYGDAGLAAASSYTYRVRATDAADNLSTYSPAGSATTLTPTPAPTAPAGPTPTSSATGIPLSVVLSWNASANATQYDVAFGTTNPPAVVVSNQTSTAYQPLVLTAGTTYYWRIVANGAGGSTSGPIWSFTMLPAPTAPAGPTPASSATSVPLTVALSWAASANTTQYGVAFGTTNPPAIASSNQTSTTYQPMALAAGTKYYWQVVAKGPCGTTSGPVWSFTTVPAPPVPAGPTPASTATGVSATTMLSWAASTNATQYDVAFGTTNSPAVVSSNQTSTAYQPIGMTAGKTYYWQVVAKGAGGSTSGPVWSFTTLTAPAAPAGQTPASNATGVSLTPTLSWVASTNATQYDVAFGTTTPPAIVSSNQTSTTYQPAALLAGKTYYWQVVAKGAAGSTSGSVWSFTTLSAPTAPAGPTPASNATGVSLTQTLSWAASTNATQYDVAFGTTNPPAVVASNQALTTYQPLALVAGATYYWQIVAKGAGGSTSGPIWNFTTAAAARPAPVAAYAFNEGAGTTTGDASGNGRTGALTNATWTAAGKNGGALSFNGTSSRVTVSDAPALHLASGMTLEAWINPSGAGAPDWQAIIYKGTDNYTIATLGSNLPTAAGMVGGTLAMPTSATTLPLNAWTHVAATYDGATMRLFVNGTQVASQPATGVFDVSTNPLEIGGSLVDGGRFAGLIDDVRVYNTALTPAQIQADMTTPVAGAIDTQAPTAPTTLTVTAVSTTQVTLTWAASTDTVGVTGYRIERCAGAGCTTFSQVGTAGTTSYSDAVLASATSYIYRVRATDAAGNLSTYSPTATATTLTPTPAPSAPAGPTPTSNATGMSLTQTLSWAASTNATQYDVAFGTTNPPAVVASNQALTTYQPLALVAGATYYWQIVAKGAGGSTSGPIWNFTTAAAARPAPVAAYAFNEGAGTTTGDASGNGRTGALTNATWTAAGKNGGALSFNGTSSRVTVSDAPALHLASGMTLEAWINPSGAGAPDWQAIIYKGTDNYTIATLGSNLPTAAGMVGGTLAMPTSATTLPLNAWTHVAATYDGATMRLFVNGTQVASQPATGVFDVSTNPLEIGGSLVDGGRFAGLIDDVRVYNTALTPAQIQADMTTPVTTATQSAAPTAPSGPLPANGATNVLTTIALNWTASTNAVQYDVAFGTTNPPPTVATNLGTTFYQPTAAFTNGTTYFWQVTAKGAGGTTSGPVWSFTAQPAAAAGLATLSSASSEAQPLRLMTWNVNGGNNLAGAQNVDAQVALMASSGAQVITLQGVTISTLGDLSALYQSKLENVTSRTWNTVWIPDPRLASAKPEGNLFLTTLPIVGSATTDLDSAPINPTLLDAKRSAGWIGVAFNNVTVHVVTTQLAVDTTQRASQLAQLGGWIATVPKPRLIGGDFNMLPTDTTYQQMSSGFADAWTAIVKTGEAGATQNLPSSQAGRVDYWWSELTDRHATPSAIKVVETSSSNHFAVVVDVNVQ